MGNAAIDARQRYTFIRALRLSLKFGINPNIAKKIAIVEKTIQRKSLLNP